MTLKGTKRESRGTRACRDLRKGGKVPAILYGRKKDALSFQVDSEEFTEALRQHTRMFELHLDEIKDTVLLKDIQYDSFGDYIVHIDFVRIALDEAVTLEVPILLKGHPKVEHAVLEQTLAIVKIECLPRDIPEAVILQVADIQLDETRTVKDITVPAGVKILTPPEVIVAAMKAIKEEVAAAPGAAPVAAAAATGVEPELIRKEKAEEGEEGEEEAGKKDAKK
ncbi:MAG: 50S ribosomal protein L25 [Planctomycetota bacterium]|nr:50S ribosomal protein L25 [Planctomycetota bacterium]